MYLARADDPASAKTSLEAELRTILRAMAE
jgi:hypothetical protein